MAKRINEGTVLRQIKVIESIGNCKNWKKCKNLDVELGNGLCVECWDKNLSKRFYDNSKHNRQKYIFDNNECYQIEELLMEELELKNHQK